jgi:ketopantoate hydroxymethyltransferase
VSLETRDDRRRVPIRWGTMGRANVFDRSILFYHDLLGFELIHTQEQTNEYTRRLGDAPSQLNAGCYAFADRVDPCIVPRRGHALRG